MARLDMNGILTLHVETTSQADIGTLLTTAIARFKLNIKWGVVADGT